MSVMITHAGNVDISHVRRLYLLFHCDISPLWAAIRNVGNVADVRLM